MDDWLIKKYEAEKSSGGVRKKINFANQKPIICAVNFLPEEMKNGIPVVTTRLQNARILFERF
jgi:hypothetical protein